MLTGIPAGELRRRITLQSKTVTSDPDTNEPIATWADISTNPTVFAKVEQLRASELAAQNTVLTIKDRAFTIRYRDDITELNRIVFDGRNFDVQSADEDTNYGQHVALRIVARATA